MSSNHEPIHRQSLSVSRLGAQGAQAAVAVAIWSFAASTHSSTPAETLCRTTSLASVDVGGTLAAARRSLALPGWEFRVRGFNPMAGVAWLGV
jgi:hypothetical protein